MNKVNDTTKTIIVAIIAFFVVLFIYTKLAGPIPFYVNSVQTTKSNFFYVQGTGEATGVPDTAQVNLGVTETATTIESAQTQVNQATEKLLKDLVALGISEKDIKTTNYSVNPSYDYSGGTQRVTGYTVTQDMIVTVKKVELANKVLDTATADGANLIGGLVFVLSDEEKKKLTQEAQAQGIKNAKEQAESLANAAGIRLGKIVDIQVYPDTSGYPDAYGAGGQGETLKANVAPPTQVNPGESTIKLSVSLSYETL